MSGYTAKLAAFLLILSYCIPIQAAYEQSVNCGAIDQTSKAYPSSQITKQIADNVSRIVILGFSWSSKPLILGDSTIGMEFKTYNYNHDEAALRGKGPAYVTGPGGFFKCNLPGCYLNTDFWSHTNSIGEYNEPQVAVGIAPEHGSEIEPNKDYLVVTRAISGRGDKALLKALNKVTKRVAYIGVSGIYLCKDAPDQNVITF